VRIKYRWRQAAHRPEALMAMDTRRNQSGDADLEENWRR
jgi:hypothetical protein